MSDPVVSQQYEDNPTNNSLTKRKKLSVTDELLGNTRQFKSMIISQKKHIICVPDPVKCENVKLGCDDANNTKRLLRDNIRTLEDSIARERMYGQEYVVNLTKYLNELRQINRDKENHIKHLERFMIDDERTIETLRTDIESVHNAYESKKRRFHKSCLEEFGPTVLTEIEKFKTFFDDASKNVLQNTGNVAVITTIVEDLYSDVHALAAEIEGFAEFSNDDQKRSKAEIIEMITRQLDDICIGISVRINADSIFAIVDHLEEDCPRIKNFFALWYVIKSVYEKNLTLENAVDVLDLQIETLQTKLSRLTAKHVALSVSKSDKKCRAVVLDDFCAVTGEITAHQMRNLEFSRILAVDNEQLTEELDKIEQLKVKISKKKKKKQKHFSETRVIINQLIINKNQYEELERRKDFLTKDLFSMKRSPSKLASQCELLIAGQRMKHLKQLKVQYNKLANKRDALKIKLQKYQQLSRTPVG